MSISHHIERSNGSVIEFVFTEHGDGDFHIDASPDALSERRVGVMAGDWAVVRQVHGARVVDAREVLGASGGHGSSTTAPEADAIVTGEVDQPIAVQGADCAPLMFVTKSGPIGVAHAGWRGLEAGVIRSVVGELSDRGAEVSKVVVGPVICSACYEFGADDLEIVAAALGESVRGVSSAGTPALDMRAAITASCSAAGIENVSFVRPCTSCEGGGFSHRARRDSQRHCLVARIRPSQTVSA